MGLDVGQKLYPKMGIGPVESLQCRCSSAAEQRSHTAKVGCSNQPTGTIPAVVQWPERLNVAQEVDGSIPSPGTNRFLDIDPILSDSDQCPTFLIEDDLF